MTDLLNDAPSTTPSIRSNDPDVLLIDINGLGYAAMYQPNLARLSFNGHSTAALHGAITSVLSRMNEFPNAVPVVLWDGHAKWRRDLFAGYKSNRSDNADKIAIRDAYNLQVPVIQKMLMQMGIPQVRSPSAEADDLAGVVVRELNRRWRIQMVTRDTDWWQALDERTSWYSPLSKNDMTLEMFSDPNVGVGSDGYFLNTQEYLMCKALAGDSSDTIPGVDGIGLKTAAKYIRQYDGSIENLWQRFDAGEKIKGAKLEALVTPQTREIYARNLVLMDWKQAPELDTSTLSAAWLSPDLGLLEEIADDFGLTKVVASARKVGDRRAAWGPAWFDVCQALGI